AELGDLGGDLGGVAAVGLLLARPVGVARAEEELGRGQGDLVVGAAEHLTEAGAGLGAGLGDEVALGLAVESIPRVGVAADPLAAGLGGAARLVAGLYPRGAARPPLRRGPGEGREKGRGGFPRRPGGSPR